jgi:hypothetical protein
MLTERGRIRRNPNAHVERGSEVHLVEEAAGDTFQPLLSDLMGIHRARDTCTDSSFRMTAGEEERAFHTCTDQLGPKQEYRCVILLGNVPGGDGGAVAPAAVPVRSEEFREGPRERLAPYWSGLVSSDLLRRTTFFGDDTGLKREQSYF